MCRSYSDLNFGVTFFGTQCRCRFLHLNQFLSVVNSVMCCHGRRLQRGEGWARGQVPQNLEWWYFIICFCLLFIVMCASKTNLQKQIIKYPHSKFWGTSPPRCNLRPWQHITLLTTLSNWFKCRKRHLFRKEFTKRSNTICGSWYSCASGLGLVLYCVLLWEGVN